MGWGKFVFWSYSFSILLPAILVICLLLFLFTDSNCLPGSSSWFCLVVSHSCRCQRHFSVPVGKHRWASSALRLWPAQGLTVVFWPCSATRCATWQNRRLPVLLRVFSFKVCTMSKGIESYLLSTSHVDFSGLFLFCFECEWEVFGHFMWLRLSFLYGGALWGNVCIWWLFMVSWAWRADGHSLLWFCLVTEELSVHAISQRLILFMLFDNCWTFPATDLEEELHLPPLDFFEFKLLEWIKDRGHIPKLLGCEIR